MGFLDDIVSGITGEPTDASKQPASTPIITPDIVQNAQRTATNSSVVQPTQEVSKPYDINTNFKLTAPGAETHEDKSLLEEGADLVSDLWTAGTGFVSNLWHHTISNEDTAHGINDWNKFQDYTSKIRYAPDDNTKQQIWKQMQDEGVISKDYNSLNNDNKLASEFEDKDEKAVRAKLYAQKQEDFREELKGNLKAYFQQLQWPEQRALSRQLENGIDELAEKYKYFYSNINETDADSKDFDKTAYFAELDNKWKKNVTDIASAWADNLIKTKDASQAYSKALEGNREKQDYINDFSTELEINSHNASANKLFDSGDPLSMLYAATNKTFGNIGVATKALIRGGMEKAFEGGQDVTGALSHLAAYDSTTAAQTNVLSNLAWSVADALPTIGGIAAEVASVNKIGGLAKAAGAAVAGASQVEKWLEILNNIQSTKAGARAIGIASELAEDSLKYDAAAQLMLGRGMNEEDIKQNLAGNLFFDTAIGMFRKPLKVMENYNDVLKGYAPDNASKVPVSQDVLQHLANGETELAKAQMLSDSVNPVKTTPEGDAKVADINVDTLPTNVKTQVQSLQFDVASINTRVENNELTNSDIASMFYAGKIDQDVELTAKQKAAQFAQFQTVTNDVLKNVASNTPSAVSNKIGLQAIKDTIQSAPEQAEAIKNMIDNDIANTQNYFKARKLFTPESQVVNEGAAEFVKHQLGLEYDATKISDMTKDPTFNSSVFTQKVGTITNNVINQHLVKNDLVPKGTMIGTFISKGDGTYWNIVKKQSVDKAEVLGTSLSQSRSLNNVADFVQKIDSTVDTIDIPRALNLVKDDGTPLFSRTRGEGRPKAYTNLAQTALDGMGITHQNGVISKVDALKIKDNLISIARKEDATILTKEEYNTLKLANLQSEADKLLPHYAWDDLWVFDKADGNYHLNLDELDKAEVSASIKTTLVEDGAQGVSDYLSVASKANTAKKDIAKSGFESAAKSRIDKLPDEMKDILENITRQVASDSEYFKTATLTKNDIELAREAIAEASENLKAKEAILMTRVKDNIAFAGQLKFREKRTIEGSEAMFEKYLKESGEEIKVNKAGNMYFVYNGVEFFKNAPGFKINGAHMPYTVHNTGLLADVNYLKDARDMLKRNASFFNETISIKHRTDTGAFVMKGDEKKIYIAQRLLKDFGSAETTVTLLHEAGHAFVSTLNKEDRKLFLQSLAESTEAFKGKTAKLSASDLDAMEERFVEYAALHIGYGLGGQMYSKFKTLLLKFIGKLKESLGLQPSFETLLNNKTNEFRKWLTKNRTEEELAEAATSGQVFNTLIAQMIKANDIDLKALPRQLDDFYDMDKYGIASHIAYPKFLVEVLDTLVERSTTFKKVFDSKETWLEKQTFIENVLSGYLNRADFIKDMKFAGQAKPFAEMDMRKKDAVMKFTYNYLTENFKGTTRIRPVATQAIVEQLSDLFITPELLKRTADNFLENYNNVFLGANRLNPKHLPMIKETSGFMDTIRQTLEESNSIVDDLEKAQYVNTALDAIAIQLYKMVLSAPDGAKANRTVLAVIDQLKNDMPRYIANKHTLNGVLSNKSIQAVKSKASYIPIDIPTYPVLNKSGNAIQNDLANGIQDKMGKLDSVTNTPIYNRVVFIGKQIKETEKSSHIMVLNKPITVETKLSSAIANDTTLYIIGQDASINAELLRGGALAKNENVIMTDITFKVDSNGDVFFDPVYTDGVQTLIPSLKTHGILDSDELGLTIKDTTPLQGISMAASIDNNSKYTDKFLSEGLKSYNGTIPYNTQKRNIIRWTFNARANTPQMKTVIDYLYEISPENRELQAALKATIEDDLVKNIDKDLVTIGITAPINYWNELTNHTMNRQAVLNKYDKYQEALASTNNASEALDTVLDDLIKGDGSLNDIQDTVTTALQSTDSTDYAKIEQLWGNPLTSAFGFTIDRYITTQIAKNLLDAKAAAVAGTEKELSSKQLVDKAKDLYSNMIYKTSTGSAKKLESLAMLRAIFKTDIAERYGVGAALKSTKASELYSFFNKNTSATAVARKISDMSPEDDIERYLSDMIEQMFTDLSDIVWGIGVKKTVAEKAKVVKATNEEIKDALETFVGKHFNLDTIKPLQESGKIMPSEYENILANTYKLIVSSDRIQDIQKMIKDKTIDANVLRLLKMREGDIRIIQSVDVANDKAIQRLAYQIDEQIPSIKREEAQELSSAERGLLNYQLEENDLGIPGLSTSSMEDIQKFIEDFAIEYDKVVKSETDRVFANIEDCVPAKLSSDKRVINDDGTYQDMGIHYEIPYNFKMLGHAIKTNEPQSYAQFLKTLEDSYFIGDDMKKHYLGIARSMDGAIKRIDAGVDAAFDDLRKIESLEDFNKWAKDNKAFAVMGDGTRVDITRDGYEGYLSNSIANRLSEYLRKRNAGSVEMGDKVVLTLQTPSGMSYRYTTNNIFMFPTWKRAVLKEVDGVATIPAKVNYLAHSVEAQLATAKRKQSMEIFLTKLSKDSDYIGRQELSKTFNLDGETALKNISSQDLAACTAWRNELNNVSIKDFIRGYADELVIARKLSDGDAIVEKNVFGFYGWVLPKLEEAEKVSIRDIFQVPAGKRLSLTINNQDIRTLDDLISQTSIDKVSRVEDMREVNKALFDEAPRGIEEGFDEFTGERIYSSEILQDFVPSIIETKPFAAVIGGKKSWFKLVLGNDGISLKKMQDSDWAQNTHKANQDFIDKIRQSLPGDFNEKDIVKNTSLDKEAEEAIMKTSADSAMCDLF